MIYEQFKLLTIIIIIILGHFTADGSIATPYSTTCSILYAEKENVPPPAPSTDQQSSTNAEVRWAERETNEFLGICKDEAIAEVGKNTHKWLKVSEKMKTLGFKRTPKMCKNKWTKIKAEYLKWLQTQKSTGSAATTFKFQQVMHEILADKHHVMPTVLFTAAGQIAQKCNLNASPAGTSPSNRNVVSAPTTSSLLNNFAAGPSSSNLNVLAGTPSSPNSLPFQVFGSPSLIEPEFKKARRNKKLGIFEALEQTQVLQKEILEVQKQQVAETCSALREVASAIRFLAEKLDK
jgi:hypothetical protein